MSSFTSQHRAEKSRGRSNMKRLVTVSISVTLIAVIASFTSCGDAKRASVNSLPGTYSDSSGGKIILRENGYFLDYRNGKLVSLGKWHTDGDNFLYLSRCVDGTGNEKLLPNCRKFANNKIIFLIEEEDGKPYLYLGEKRSYNYYKK